MQDEEKSIFDIKSQFIGAIKEDIGAHPANKKNIAEFFTNAIRSICGIHINQIRSTNGLTKASTSYADIKIALKKIISSRPITEENVISAILEMPDKQIGFNNNLSALQSKTATGITRFMSLSRNSMKYGSERLMPLGIVAELQSDYVNRVHVSKFSDKNFYRSREWKELRLAVLSVCDKCKLCGASKESGAVMHVDHIKPRSLWPELSLSIENMQLLCSDCNLAKSNVISEKY